jgi:aminomethyltransferase
MKNTPFTNKHIALGAKMAEFAGYNMPISYTGINDEHAAVRKNAGVFDVSHMGEFILKGRNALDLIQRVHFQRCFEACKWKSAVQLFAK